MNPVVRFFLKFASKLKIDMRKNYKTVRNIQHAITPDVSDQYTIMDHKIYSPEEGHNIPIRVFLPNTERKSGVLVFFHGGGWVIGDIETYTPTCAHMAEQTGRIVYSVDYRLAPEHPFPAGLNDCYYACQHVMSHYEEITKESSDDFILIGDSAGANLAAAVSLRLRDNGHRLADKQILIYPATYWDHNMQTSPFDSVRTNGEEYGLTSERIQEYMELYIPDPELRKTQDAAPMMATDFSGQPETLVLSAEYDPLRDEGETYAYMLKRAGNDVKLRRILEAPHGFLNYPDVTGGIEESYLVINAFLDERFESARSANESKNPEENTTRRNSNKQKSRKLSNREIELIQVFLSKIEVKS